MHRGFGDSFLIERWEEQRWNERLRLPPDRPGSSQPRLYRRDVVALARLCRGYRGRPC